jgi:hypothetical protein
LPLWQAHSSAHCVGGDGGGGDGLFEFNGMKNIASGSVQEILSGMCAIWMAVAKVLTATQTLSKMIKTRSYARS